MQRVRVACPLLQSHPNTVATERLPLAKQTNGTCVVQVRLPQLGLYMASAVLLIHQQHSQSLQGGGRQGAQFLWLTNED